MNSIFEAIAYNIIAILIIRRHPRHAVGWLFMIVGAIASLGASFELAAAILGVTEEQAITSPSFITGVFAVYGSTSWVPRIMIPITLVVQVFPTGRLPSRRWIPVTAASVFGMSFVFLRLALSPYPIPEVGIEAPYNPFAVAAVAQTLAQLQPAAEAAFAVGWSGSVILLIVRFTRSKGTERTQMKWFMYVATLILVGLLVSDLLLGAENPLSFRLFQLAPTLLAVTVAISILRYQLFDIDLIIRRSLQYGLLSGTLLLIYYGLVVASQYLLKAPGSGQSGLYIVISTLIVAALFNPLRVRIQSTIDRRFYRQKYEAEKAVAKFATTARDEVDLQRLAGSLLGIVAKTIQPAHLSLWLAEREKEVHE